MSSPRYCNWSDLGAVTEPGEYNLYHVGMVTVAQSDIDLADQSGGKIRFRLVDLPPSADGKKAYRLQPRA